MPKYDAFGREIGEDTLAGLGGDPATVDTTPAPEPAPARADDRPAPPQLAIPDAPPGQRVRVRRARGVGCLVGLLVAAAVVVGPILAVVSFVDTAGDVIEDATGTLETLPGAGDPSAPEAAPPPAGIAGRSMIAPRNVRRALGRLEQDGVEAVARITIRPDRLRAESVKGRRLRAVELRAGATLRRGDARAFDPADGAIPLRDLDPRTPARLVRNAAKRYRVRPQGIDHVIASYDVFDGGGQRWIAYFKNGIYVEGDERGRVVGRIS